MDKATVQGMAADLGAFLRAVRIETDGGPRPWAEVAATWQRTDVEQIGPALRRLVDPKAPEPVKTRAFWVRPRGHSKTADAILLGLWVVAFSRRRRRGMWIAADLAQGVEGLTLARLVVRHNPWLAELLTLQSTAVVANATGSRIDFATSDAASNYGWANVDLVFMDELCHWDKGDNFTAAFSAAGKRKAAVVLVASNAGWEPSWQADLLAAVKDRPEWIVSQLPGTVASWIDLGRLSEQAALLPRQEYDRLWRNIWQSGGGGDAFTPAEIEAICTLPGPASGPREGYSFVAGVDSATRRDASCVAILAVPGVAENGAWVRRTLADLAAAPVVGVPGAAGDDDPYWFDRLLASRERRASAVPEPEKADEAAGKGKRRRLRLAALKVWKPRPGRKVSLKAVRDYLLEAHRRFGLRTTWADPSQAERLAEELTEAGMRVRLVPQTGGHLQAQSAALLEAVREHELLVYPDADLVSDFKSALIVQKTYGWRLDFRRTGFRPDKPGTPHGDVTSAIGLAVCAAKAARTAGVKVARVGRPLYCE